MKPARLSLIGFVGITMLAAACSSSETPDTKGGTGGTGGTAPAAGGNGTGGTGGSVGGTAGAHTTGGSAGTTSTGGSGGAGGTGGSTTGGTGGSTTGGTGGSTTGGAGGTAGVGGGAGGSGGMTGGSAGAPPAVGGASGAAGSGPGGAAGSSGSAGSAGTGGTPVDLPPLVTSASGAYWKTDGALTDSTASATVTVNDTMAQQKWDGFGGAFNELGWKALSSASMQADAIKLLFSATDGANFAWGRIPMGASDYAEKRYTPEDITGADPTPDSTESNRPAADTSLANFKLDRDMMYLIPYIKAALGVKPDLRFWASPWTPPVWMKTSYKKNSGADSSQNAKKPSYYDGGNMKSDAATLTAFAGYYTKFVQGYKDNGIKIEIVSPQNEPGYDQNYPSCLWDGTTYGTFIGQYLGPAMAAFSNPSVKVMLGTLSNDKTDFTVAQGAVSNSMAKPFLAVVGAQWNTLDASKLSGLNSGLPFWATEHKCGNYPWNPSTGCGDTNDSCPAYNSSQAPNDQAYGVESWKYIRNAIKTVKVSAYNAWNMVLDKGGLGIDTTREWRQDALLVADGTVKPTPAYYVFRHMSQYVQPGATVVGTSGGDALAWKNPDGSLVAVMYNSGAANASYVVAIGGKKLSFAMPSNGWATVKVKP